MPWTLCNWVCCVSTTGTFTDQGRAHVLTIWPSSWTPLNGTSMWVATCTSSVIVSCNTISQEYSLSFYSSILSHAAVPGMKSTSTLPLLNTTSTIPLIMPSLETLSNAGIETLSPIIVLVTSSTELETELELEPGPRLLDYRTCIIHQWVRNHADRPGKSHCLEVVGRRTWNRKRQWSCLYVIAGHSF